MGNVNLYINLEIFQLLRLRLAPQRSLLAVAVRSFWLLVSYRTLASKKAAYLKKAVLLRI